MNVSLFVLSICLYVSFFLKVGGIIFFQMFKFCRFICFTKLFEIYKKIDFFAFLPYLFRNVVILIQIVKNAKFPNDKEKISSSDFLTREAFLNLNIPPSSSFWTKLNQNFKLVLHTNFIRFIVFESESLKVEKEKCLLWISN